jgi:hypothetical protein
VAAGFVYLLNGKLLFSQVNLLSLVKLTAPLLYFLILVLPLAYRRQEPYIGTLKVMIERST